MSAGDYVSFGIITILLLATCFLGEQRGHEATSVNRQIELLEQKISELAPLPQIHIQRASVYSGKGDLIIETFKSK